MQINTLIIKSKLTFGLGLLALIIITNCTSTKEVDPDFILKQLPVDNRIILVPSSFINNATSGYNLLPFSDIDGTKDEEEFYNKIRKLGVQYVLISSEMTLENNEQFPWMTNKNFRICPGNVDHKTDKYYILLVWDNTINSYHFFKFVYGEK